MVFSVIVPVYNVKGYLAQCIESILAQSEKSFELLLVDDGSTDGSGEVCDEYALSLIHIDAADDKARVD
ncbi:MAG: glycosyltransferase, partial [Odoribacter sp.]|nr:glycosyltransferase [Odoribacter sp.]